MSTLLRVHAQAIRRLCGIATSLLTVAVVVLIERLFEVSIVGWMLWFFVPAGAILCGLVAASGYFGGALLFHRRPGPFVPMVSRYSATQLALLDETLFYSIKRLAWLVASLVRVESVVEVLPQLAMLRPDQSGPPRGGLCRV